MNDKKEIAQSIKPLKRRSKKKSLENETVKSDRISMQKKGDVFKRKILSDVEKAKVLFNKSDDDVKTYDEIVTLFSQLSPDKMIEAAVSIYSKL